KGEDSRAVDLLAVYGKLAGALAGSPHDVVAVLLQTARLHDVLGEGTAALAAYRDVFALSPATRAALFRLESRARDAGRLEDLARPFAADPRAQATFLTRAGEALADLERPDDAIARFRAAEEALPGHAPALRSWRRVALLAGRWHDVVDVCDREAQAAVKDS